MLRAIEAEFDARAAGGDLFSRIRQTNRLCEMWATAVEQQHARVTEEYPRIQGGGFDLQFPHSNLADQHNGVN
jgi:hypothetical protein